MFKVKLIVLSALISLFFLACEEEHKNPTLPADVDHQLYVVNSLGQTITLIDLDADTVYKNLYQTGTYPAEIEFHDGSLYIINSGDNTIQIINTESGEQRIIEIGDNRNPAFFELITPQIAAVSNWVTGTISFVNLDSDSVETEIPVGAAPWGMAYYDQKLFVAFSNYDPNTWSYGQGRVAMVDAVNRTLLDSVDVGVNPGLLFLDKQDELNVICIGDYFTTFGQIWGINPDNFSLIGHYDIGKSPAQQAMNEQGIVYLAAGGLLDNNWQPVEGYVLNYSSVTETPFHSGSNPIVIPGTSILGVAVDSDNGIFISCFSLDQVLRINENGTVLETYDDVGDGPERLLYVEIEH